MTEKRKTGARRGKVSRNYGLHVVAFVDILGFAELVQRLDRNPELIDEIYDVLSRAREEEVTALFSGWLQQGLAEFTVASDSMFFSISIDRWKRTKRSEAHACLAVIESVFWLQRYLLRRGVLTRGGIARGHLLHRRGIIFGPALVDAYRLESQVAFFPRTIVTEEILQIVLKSGPRGFEFPGRLSSITRRDVDGLTFVDYLHVDSMAIERSDLFRSLYKDIRHSIERALVVTDRDIRAFQKTAWLARYYNDSAVRIANDDELREIGLDVMPIDIEASRGRRTLSQVRRRSRTR